MTEAFGTRVIAEVLFIVSQGITKAVARVAAQESRAKSELESGSKDCFIFLALVDKAHIVPPVQLLTELNFP